MKLVSYLEPGDASPRIGSQQGDDVVDLRRAYAATLADDPFAFEIAAVRIPGDMVRFLEGGTRSMEAARAADKFARQGGESLRADRIVQRASAVRLLTPVPRPRKVIGVGGTYQAHIDEVHKQGMKLDVPDYPLASLKMATAVIGPDEDIIRSRLTDELDYEIEIGLVIGKRCKDVPASEWRSVVAGLTVINDVSMRDLIAQEAQSHGIHFKGKNLDTCCPIGPCIATLDEFEDTRDIDLELRVNGEVRQRDNTRNLTHDFGAILAHWSCVTLEPGDVVTTGTTAGVAGFFKRQPEKLLKAGDVIEAEVRGVGILRNRVVDEVGRSS